MASVVPPSIQKIETALATRKNVSQVLEQFGTLLRDEGNRRAASARRVVPQAVSFFHLEPFLVLRILINFSADNAENRRYLLSEVPALVAFWAKALAKPAAPDTPRYVMTLINQFVLAVEEDEEREFVGQLLQKGAVEWVFAYHETLGDTPAEMAAPMEFLVAYARLFSEHVTVAQFDRVARGLAMLRSVQADAAADALESHAQFLLSCTSVDDSCTAYDTGRIRDVLLAMPVRDAPLAAVARKLFAACGNIYSWPSHDNWQDMERKVGDLACGVDAVAACAAVSLGNCVSSEASQAELARRIAQVAPLEGVAQGLVQRAFTDVVYYQAYHFLNNAMTKHVAQHLLVAANAPAFYRNTKVVVDNAAYYPEVARLYFKFARKLVALACVEGHADAMLFRDAWLYMLGTDEAAETALLVLQALARRHDPGNGFQIPLVAAALKLGPAIDVRTLLLKITAVAVFLRHYSADEVRAMYGADGFGFARDFLPQLLAFLGHLETALAQAPAAEHSAAAQNTLANNSRFLALAAQQNLQAVHTPHEPLVLAVCETAARILATATQ